MRHLISPARFDHEPVNRLDVPEIRNWRRDVRGAVTVVSYEIRDPGDRHWRRVELDRETDTDGEPSPA